MKKLRLILLLPALILAAVLATGARNGDRAKARHFFLLGAEAAQQDRNDEAYEYYKKAYRTDPSYEAAAYQYGQLRLQTTFDTLNTRREVDSSLSLLRSFVEAYPDEMNEGMYYGYLARLSGDFSDAAKIYRRVYDHNPSKTSVLLHLAEMERMRGNLDSAISALDTYERIEGSHPQLSISRLQLLVAKGDTAGALRSITSLVESHPLDPRFLLVRGYLNEAIGDTAATRADYMEAERIAPESGEVKMALAEWAVNNGDTIAYDRYTSEALYCDDLEFGQKKELLRGYVAKLLADSTGYSRGEELFRILNQQYPHNPELITLDASYRVEIGEEEEAVELMRYTTDLEPDNNVNWSRLMTMLIQFDRPAEAYEVYRSMPVSQRDYVTQTLASMAAARAERYSETVALSVEMLDTLLHVRDLFQPLSPRIVRSLSESDRAKLKAIYTQAGDAYYQAEMPDSAFAVYEVIMQAEPNDPYILNNYAYFISEKGSDLEKAEKMSRLSIDLEPDNPTYLDTYGWILYRLKDLEGAESYLRKAIETAEERESLSAEYFRHLAEVLREKGDASGAGEARRRASELEAEEKAAESRRKEERLARRRAVEEKRRIEQNKRK